MKKTQTTRKQDQKTVAPVVMPPGVAALATFVNDCDGKIDPEFLYVWQHMPALVAQMIAGEGDSNRGTTKSSVIEGAVERDLAIRIAGNDFARRQAQRIGTLQRMDSDLWTDLHVTLGAAAFNAGLALGMFLLTNATPVTIPADGAR